MRNINTMIINKLRELGTCRHNIHKSSLNTNKHLFEHNLKKLNMLCQEINLDNIAKLDLTDKIEELLYYYDEKDFDIFEEEKENLNDEIENYLSDIDSVYGTHFCPIGSLRNTTYLNSNAIEVHRGMIFWVNRNMNGLFSTDDEKAKRIPAIVISNNRWNRTHDSYVVLSVSRKDDFVKDCEYNVNFMLNNTEHIIRCFNPFTVRKIHMGDYITTVDEDIMNKVGNLINSFIDFSIEQSDEEIELSETIERIMRDKSEKIKHEMIKDSCLKSMQIINSQLNALYPNNVVEEVKEEKIEIKKETPVVKIKEESKICNSTSKKYNRWDKETAQKYLDDYENIKDRQELARIYGFKSKNSIYSRLQKCRQIVQQG